jgi:hypothetical protein
MGFLSHSEIRFPANSQLLTMSIDASLIMERKWESKPRRSLHPRCSFEVIQILSSLYSTTIEAQINKSRYTPLSVL